MGIIIMPDSPSIKSKKQKIVTRWASPPQKKTEHKIPWYPLYKMGSQPAQAMSQKNSQINPNQN